MLLCMLTPHLALELSNNALEHVAHIALSLGSRGWLVVRTQERLERLLKRPLLLPPTLPKLVIQKARERLRYGPKHTEIKLISIRPLPAAGLSEQQVLAGSATSTARWEESEVSVAHIALKLSKLQAMEIPPEKIQLACWPPPAGRCAIGAN